MALPSQSPRIAAAGRAVVRTHRRRALRVPRLAAAAVILVVGTVAAWALTRGGEGSGPLTPESASASDQVLEAPYTPTQTARTNSLTNSRPTPPGSKPQESAKPQAAPPESPVEISQGGRSAAEQAGGAGQPGGQGPLVLGSPTTLGESLDRASADPETEPAPKTETPAPKVETGALARALAAADQRLAANDPVAARVVLSNALGDPSLTESDRSQLRARLTAINQDLLFSSKVVKGDPMAETYAIASGDALSRLPDKLGLAVDWRLIQRVNGIADPNKIQLGQKVKLVRGPFHAVVHKSDYRLDLYAGPPEEESAWTYIRSFRVGLGEPKESPTPTGTFVVKRNSKLINPHWVNPKTGEKFDQNNPENPIGERWIGLDGIGADAVKEGYGIHGTIDPSSIGGQKSMGCVRMLDEDVNLVYEMLVEGISRVRIVD